MRSKNHLNLKKWQTMKSKYNLIEHFAELGFTIGAEVGVSMGHLSEAMFKAIPKLKLYCVDVWDHSANNRWSASARKNAVYYRRACQKLAPYNSELIKDTSMNAVKRIPDGSLDFVYIDACHAFDYVMEDLINWSKKVKKGGIVSGDDYYHFGGAGVVEAVDAYAKAHKIEVQLTDPYPDIMDRGHHEKPSFYWVKR